MTRLPSFSGSGHNVLVTGFDPVKPAQLPHPQPDVHQIRVMLDSAIKAEEIHIQRRQRQVLKKATYDHVPRIAQRDDNLGTVSDQWFVKMGDLADGRPGLAQLAIDAVNDGRVRFFPERYAQTYLDWLGEKRDWCVSRQLWWGHRIPIWYTRCSRGRAEERLRRPVRRDLAARRGDRPTAGAAPRRPAAPTRWAALSAGAGPRRARHLVQLGAVAALAPSAGPSRRRNWPTIIRRARW